MSTEQTNKNIFTYALNEWYFEQFQRDLEQNVFNDLY